jgi:hypothetical protein
MPLRVPFGVLLMGLLAACAASPEGVTPEDMTAADHTQTEQGEIDRIFLELIRAALADEMHGVWREPESEMMPEMPPEMMPDPGSEMFLDLQRETMQQYEMQRLIQGLEAPP